jgi:excisionase family DNA binding protein
MYEHGEDSEKAGESGKAEGDRPLFYSVTQVARLLGTSPVTLYRAIADGEFPAVRIRGRLIVPAKAVDQMAEAAVNGHAIVDAAGWVQAPRTQRGA